ncbi:filamentous hemagglutinin N-terminal domain-containing protein [Roseateles sp.]|uniref:two-partner secretion domain-containing protein n=1 Tax=Roseateles sp. TaxID=1971397 RepID=UPI002F42DA8B
MLAAAAWLAVQATLVTTAVAQVPGQAPAPTDLPILARPVAGDVQVDPPTGGHLLIHQRSGRAAIEWQRFDIGEHASVTFRQPDSSSVAVNRVVGEGASRILGSLKSDGQVFLLNAQGVVFGPKARIDVRGLAVSTQPHDDTWPRLDADGMRAEGLGGGPISVDGQVHVHKGGLTILQGGQIVIAGGIRSPGGQVWVRGSDVQIGKVDVGVGIDVNVDVDAPGTTPAGLIDIRADGRPEVAGVPLRVIGRTTLTASAGQSGPGGRVALRSSAGLHVDNRARLRVKGGGPADVAGTIELLAQAGRRPMPTLDFGETRGGQLTLGAHAWQIGAGERRRRSDLPPDSEQGAPAHLKAADLSAWLDEGRSVHLAAVGAITVTQPIVTTDAGADAGGLSMSARDIRLDAPIERAAGDLALSTVRGGGTVGAITMSPGSVIQAPRSTVAFKLPPRAPSLSSGPADRLTLGVVNAGRLKVDTGNDLVAITMAGQEDARSTRADLLRAGEHGITLLPEGNLNVRVAEIAAGPSQGPAVGLEASTPATFDDALPKETRIDAGTPLPSLPSSPPTQQTSQGLPVTFAPEPSQESTQMKRPAQPPEPPPEQPLEQPPEQRDDPARTQVSVASDQPTRTPSRRLAPATSRTPSSTASDVADRVSISTCLRGPQEFRAPGRPCEERRFHELLKPPVPSLTERGGIRPVDDAMAATPAP